MRKRRTLMISTVLLSMAWQVGCAAMGTSDPDEISLPGTSWLAEDLGGRGVIDHLQSTLTFDGAERVAGNAGCNRYFGAVTLDGARIRFGNLGATRMMCPPAVMDQEQRLFDALGQAERFGFGPPGILTLYDAAGAPVARFSRMADAAG
jgi:heat shock protein HslJ